MLLYIKRNRRTEVNSSYAHGSSSSGGEERLEEHDVPEDSHSIQPECKPGDYARCVSHDAKA